MKLDTVWNNVKEYVGVYQRKVGTYEELLKSAVDQYSAKIYDDPNKLRIALKKAGASETQIEKIYMMTLVNGFREVLQTNEQTVQICIDRYVKNAIRETGFKTSQVLDLVHAIVVSLGVEGVTNAAAALQNEGRSAFVVPLSTYKDELSQIALKIGYGQFERLSDSDVARLQTLANAGISRAKYYLGQYLLKCRSTPDQASSEGMRLLAEAAEDGDSLAAAALGDSYYELANAEGWTKALSLYTGYGAIALNNKRKERVENILNYKKFNWTLIILSALIAVGMLISVVSAPAGTIFAPYRVLGIILFFVAAAVIAVSVLHTQKKPYDSLTWTPCLVFAVWCVHLLIRLMF